MQVILAIVADQQQAAQLAALIGGRLAVDLVQAAEVGEGLLALDDRIPDLILTSPLMSPFDDGVLDEYLRDLGPAGAHVQTLRIPVLSQAPKKAPRLGFSLRRRAKPEVTTPDGCEPKVFADEIALYLERASEEKRRATANEAAAVIERHVVQDEAAPEPISEEEWTAAYGSDVVAETAAPPAAESADSNAWRSDLLERAPEDRPAYDQDEVETIAAWQADSVEEVRLKPDTTLEQVAPEPDTFPQVGLKTQTSFEQIETDYIQHAPMEEVELDDRALVDTTPAVVESFAEPVAKNALEPSYVRRPVATSPVVTDSATMAHPAPAVRQNADSDRATPSFKAALAAIRAAWGKPSSKASPPAATPAAIAATPREVDPTGVVEQRDEPKPALENPSTAEVSRPFAAADATEAPDVYELSVDTDVTDVALSLPEPSGDRRKKPVKRATKAARAKSPRSSPTTAAEDEWGMFDPDRCGFPALVDKLDEASDDKVQQPNKRGKARVLSCS
jgi:hypothetical protein